MINAITRPPRAPGRAFMITADFGVSLLRHAI